MRYRHLLRSHQAEKIWGWAALGVGFWLLYGAYEGRGRAKPKLAGPILPW